MNSTIRALKHNFILQNKNLTKQIDSKYKKNKTLNKIFTKIKGPRSPT